MGDLDLLTVIGKGAFGKVFLGKIAATGKFYAVKMLKKNTIIERNQVDYAKFECVEMGKMKHPNILGVDFVIQNENEIFLVLPFSEGGDLNKIYKK